MKPEKIEIATISPQRFTELWRETFTSGGEDAAKIYEFFKPIIETIPRLTIGEYYWQIFNNAQPFPKILMADGAVNKLTPIDAKELIKSSAEEFFSFYHPEDLPQVLTFISIVFRNILDDSPERRQHYNITVYSRIRNSEGLMIWNSIQYPALYFDEQDQFLYGMALYTNVNHLIKSDAEPMMTVRYTDESNNQKLIHYTSKNIKGIQINYPTVSPREKEIITLLSQGNSSKQIADLLGITKNTVDNHRQRLLKKFGVKSSSELVIKALIY